jgi:nucleoside-diphosphate-sugar epimerase
MHFCISDEAIFAISYVAATCHDDVRKPEERTIMTETALVAGAAGGVGGETVRALNARGWRVRAFNRARSGVDGDGVEWVRGDALDATAVAKAAEGASVIVHAVNPPGYRHWGRLVVPMLESTLQAARANQATIVLPGTVYNYGPDALPILTEESPQRPLTRKGKLRVEMEARLEAFAREGGRAIILRCGDFFGPRAGNSWFSQVVAPGRRATRVARLAPPNLGHQWAYLPDVAETLARLIDRRAALPAFAAYQFKGHWDATGEEMIDAIKRATGRPDLKVRPFPWTLLACLSPFVPLFREVGEMRYLWRTAVYMDNEKLLGALGEEPHTPWDDAVRESLRGLGCL